MSHSGEYSSRSLPVNSLGDRIRVCLPDGTDKDTESRTTLIIHSNWSGRTFIRPKSSSFGTKIFSFWVYDTLFFYEGTPSLQIVVLFSVEPLFSSRSFLSSSSITQRSRVVTVVWDGVFRSGRTEKKVCDGGSRRGIPDE